MIVELCVFGVLKSETLEEEKPRMLYEATSVRKLEEKLITLHIISSNRVV